MKAITFLLHTKQPILATSLQGDPNSDVSFSYIPGSMIRGVLISRYLQNPDLRNTDDILNDSKFPEVKRLFFDGSTRYLNAYLSSNDKEKRTLPIPRSWLKKKGDEVTDSNYVNIYDFSYEQQTEDSYKSLNESFCTVDDDNVILYKEKRRINIHNMRDRKKGRGTDDNGAVFRYDALDAGQTFQGVILCDNADDVAKIKPLLEPKDIWLGGSQSAGYGHTIIEIIPNEQEINWHEVETPLEYREDRELLRITLLSDLILRDRCGQYVAMPLMQLVTDEGEREVDSLTQLLEELLEVKLQPQSSFISSIVVGGFNRKWGLPLPQVPALAAGSVFVFNYEGELDIDRIRTLENQGIGERRVDGFGRLAVNWLEEYSKFTASLPKSETEWTEPKLEPNTEDSSIAAKMAKRLLEQKLDSRLLEKLDSDSIKLKPNKLSNSQLSRLIIVARQALTEERKNPVIDMLENLPKNASGQFEVTKIAGKSFKKQICDWLNEPSTWIDSQHLEVSIAGESVPSNLVEKLKLEYTLRLIMGIAKKASKENQNE